MQSKFQSKKQYLWAVLALFFLFMAFASFGQNKENVKVKIVKIVDGDTTVIEKDLKEDNVEAFTKQFQDIKGKNVQVMVTVDGDGKSKSRAKSHSNSSSSNTMQFNFEFDSAMANAFSNSFMFKDFIGDSTAGATCKKFVWNDSAMQHFGKNFAFQFDNENLMKDFDFNIETQEDGKAVIIKKQGGKTIVINNNEEDETVTRSEDGTTKTTSKTIIIKDDKSNTKKKMTVTTSVVVIDMDEEGNATKSDRKKVKEESEFNFYPNPSDGNFTLELDLDGKEDAIVSITDIAGKEVFSEKINDKGKTTKNISLGNNKKGTFVVTIKQGKKTTSKKIIID